MLDMPDFLFSSEGKYFHSIMLPPTCFKVMMLYSLWYTFFLSNEYQHCDLLWGKKSNFFTKILSQSELIFYREGLERLELSLSLF